MLKRLFAPADQRLLGAQVLACGGTINAFIRAVYNYPSLSEAYTAAALDGLEICEAQRASNTNGGLSTGRGTQSVRDCLCLFP
jgi:hypothetical protein